MKANKKKLKVYQMIKKPPKWAQKIAFWENENIDSEEKTMTKQQFQLYKVCIDKISNDETITWMLWKNKYKAKVFESHDCNEWSDDDIWLTGSTMLTPVNRNKNVFADRTNSVFDLTQSYIPLSQLNIDNKLGNPFLFSARKKTSW